MLVWLISAFEVVGGLLLALCRYIRGFVELLLVGVLFTHASLGWFVGEHGTGGSEFSVMMSIAFLVVAAAANRT